MRGEQYYYISIHKYYYLQTAKSPASNHLKALLMTATDSKANYKIIIREVE